MSATPLTLCDALDPDSRSKRLAAFLYPARGAVCFKDEFTRRPAVPGFCRFCGGKLPTTYRAVKWIEETNSFKWTACGHEPEAMAEAEKFYRETPTDQFGLRAGYLFHTVSVCESMEADAVWNGARAILAEQYRKREEAMNAKHKAESDREKRAAKALAGNQTF